MEPAKTVRIVYPANLRAGYANIPETEFDPDIHTLWVDPDVDLRTDGQTVQEYVSAGYLAKNYPPSGYASKSTEEEISAAIAAQDGHPGGGHDYSGFTDEHLRAAITEATGKAPHPNAGRETLIKTLQEAPKGA